MGGQLQRRVHRRDQVAVVHQRDEHEVRRRGGLGGNVVRACSLAWHAILLLERDILLLERDGEATTVCPRAKRWPGLGLGCHRYRYLQAAAIL